MKSILLPLLLLSAIGFSQESKTDQELKKEYNQQAYNCAYAEDYACALEYFSKVAKTFPLDSFVYLDRGYIKVRMGDYTGAIADFSKQIEIDSSNPDNYFLRAECEDNIGEYEKANEDYSKVCEMDEGNADSFYFRGINNMRKLKLKAALKDINKAISIAPENAIYYLSRAELYKIQRKNRKARNEFIYYFQLSKKEANLDSY